MNHSTPRTAAPVPPTLSPAARPNLTPRIVIGFIGTWVLALLAANLVPVLIGALVADLGMTVSGAGALATAMSLGSAAGMLVTNRFIPRADRPTAARIGLFGMAVGFGSGALILNPALVQAGIILGGVACGVVIASGTAAASATRNPDTTTSTVMIVNRLTAAGILAIVPLLGNDLRLILAVLAGLGLAGTLLAGGLPNAPQREQLKALQSIRPPREPFGPLAVVLAITFGAWSLTEDMVYSMVEILAVEAASLTVGQASILIAVKILGGLAGAIIAPFALRHIGRSISILGILLVSTVTKFLIVTTTSTVVYCTAVTVWGVMYGAVLTLVFGLAARMAASGRVGVLVSTIYMIGIALGPLVGGQLITHVSPLVFGLAVAVPSVIAGGIMLAVSRRSGVPEHGTDSADLDQPHHTARAVTAGEKPPVPRT